MCIDYCSINNNTVVYWYPLPRIDDIIDLLGGSMVYSKLDLATGYHQLAIEPIHTYGTAFLNWWGPYKYVVLPFGLCNTPSTFKRLMNHVFCYKLNDFVTIYYNDILFFSASIEKHEAHLHWVFNQLWKHSLKAKIKKVLFYCIKIGILGIHTNNIWCYSGPRKN